MSHSVSLVLDRENVQKLKKKKRKKNNQEKKRILSKKKLRKLSIAMI